MGICLEASCPCQDFAPFAKKRHICSSCRHEEASHYISSSEEEADSSANEANSMGTGPYIKRLQRNVAGSAVVEAIAETRSGFRPKKIINKKVRHSTNSSLL